VTPNTTQFRGDVLVIQYSDQSWLNEALEVDFSTGQGNGHEWGHTGGWNYDPFDRTTQLYGCKLE
jgi:hypothetical protein